MDKRIVLLIAALASFLTPFMGSAINIALPEIGREYSMSAIALSWVATAYLLAAAVVLVPIGRLADIKGRKLIFTIGIIVYNASTLLSAFSPTGSVLIIARLIEGVGASMIFGTGTAILISVYSREERGKALGINIAAVYLGASLGPTLGGILTERLGWRSIFLSTIPIGMLIVTLVVWKLKGEWAEAKGEPFDWKGSVIYGIGLVALMTGLSQLPEARGIFLMLGGLAGIILFGYWEYHTTSPVLDFRIFAGNRVFTLSNLAALINYSATFGIGFLLSLYLQYIQGLSPEQAGLVLVVQPAMQAIFSPLAGRLSDKVEPQIVASAGMGLLVVGLLILTQLNGVSSKHFIVFALLLLGLGFALFSSPNTNAVMSSVSKKFYGVASGTLGTMRLVGQVWSMGIVTMVFSIIIGQTQIVPEYFPLFLKSLHIVFLILCVLCILGVFASLSRGKVRKTGVALD